MRRILAIRLRTLGDIVLSTPALRALSRGHRDVELEVLTEARYVPLVAPLPEVSRVWPLGHSAGDVLAAAIALRRRGYETAVDLFGSPGSALLARASGARRIVGWDVRGRGLAYDVRVARAPAGLVGAREYAADAQLRVARAAGGIGDNEGPRLAVDPACRPAAEELLARAGIDAPSATVGLVAAGTWAAKTWPISHAAVLARRLADAGWEVLGLFGPGEEATAAALVRLAPMARVLPPCGIGALVAVIERLAAVVGTDSGPRHVAAALGVPTVAWFGPTHPVEWSPPGDRHAAVWTELPCRGCNRTTCSHWSCMPGLAPEAVSDTVLVHLERHARPVAHLGARPGA